MKALGGGRRVGDGRDREVFGRALEFCLVN